MTKELNIPPSSLGYYVCNLYHKYDGDLLLVCDSEENARLRFAQVSFFDSTVKAIYFPSWDSLPFDRVSPCSSIMAQRAAMMSDLVADYDKEYNTKHLLIMSAANFLQKVPDVQEFAHRRVEILRGEVLSQDKIAHLLVDCGYHRVTCASSPGEFAIRGEIVDIVQSEAIGHRMNLSWDKVETIKVFDPLSQVSTNVVQSLTLHPTSELHLTQENVERFKREFLKNFGTNHSSHPIYTAITNMRQFSAAEHLLPLFYDRMTSIVQYLKDPRIILESFARESIKTTSEDINDLYQSRIENNTSVGQFYPALAPSALYMSENNALEMLSNAHICKSISDHSEILPCPNFYHLSLQNHQTVVDLFIAFKKQYSPTPITICAVSASASERIKHFLEVNGIFGVNIGNVPLSSGFIAKDHIYISYYDLFGEKGLSSPTSANKKLKNILNEIENLSDGELVVHKDHGIGQFLGLETVSVGGQPHDCVKILYANNDKIYIPVENLDAIKKYGSDDAELDKLGSVSWQKRKSKMKDRIGELAIKLIKIAAERKVKTVEHISPPESYDAFCKSFAYTETDDQMRAIQDIHDDLITGYPMDRLVCGDVGFGKTEVAMRAAFLVASSGQQVVIIVPTTILCRQHYTNFLNRFRGTNFRIAQVSRLVPSAEISRIKEEIKTGKIDIVVGTHAILATDVSFYDLGLMILDEEQHFGVSQKERMKDLQSGVHALSLSATPIPRTLQMSLLGIRDLSIIATPPIDRLSVRTSVISYDPVIVRDALIRERTRGGRSFYVCPRISDIEDIANKFKTIVPELTYRIAHGQMPASTIDEIMGDFYDGKFDILLSTTIVESGIDVPAANTMIIHRAEMLGLSQLYQLRGRIGRSKARGYAYLTISDKRITKNATQRLEIIQNIESLGAGFAIASHDMDIRGFGNLVGDEQSGNIKEVGTELYHDMLENAVLELQSKVQRNDLNPSINLGLSVSLPENYICDNNIRLGLYKRMSTLETETQIEDFRDELVDRFGPIPEEVENLLSVISIKQLCKALSIESLDSGPQGFVIKFEANHNPSDAVMQFIANHPRHSKLKPDGRFVILKNLTHANIVKNVHEVLNQLSTHTIPLPKLN